MASSPNDSQSASPLPDPQIFSSSLRIRAEEALAASVHHASLSQQYLTLAQKLSALAEQSQAGQAGSIQNSFRELQREANSGIPAAPIGYFQQPLLPSSELARDIAATRPSPTGDVPSVNADGAKFSGESAAASATLNLEKSDAPPIATAKAGGKQSTSRRQKRRRRLSVRGLLDRARLTALEQAERIRLKVRKSDLKPQLRTTSQEVKEELKRGSKPAAVSMGLTAVCLFLLTLWQMQVVESEPLPPIIAGFSDPLEEVEEAIPVEPPMEESGEQQEVAVEEPIEEMIEEPEPEPEPVEEPVVEPTPEPIEQPALEMPVADAALPETPDGTLPSSAEPTEGTNLGAIDNRGEAGRKMLLEKFGGSVASESAVGFALEWLAARQRSNGSWDFTDVGACTSPGSVNNPIGGTAYALLPFLAAGQTHRDGQYKKQVQAGLEFLTSIGVNAPAGYDLRGVINRQDDDKDPNYAYYVHGAATLALCEAYGMTKDRKLKPFAEGAVGFLVNSQDPRGGGWRYNPQQPGSTSCTAIQVMALKAAEKAGIKIQGATWQGISFYLDSVAIDREGRYGYEVQKKSFTTPVTAMASLSRMYLGWGRDDGDLRKAVALIDEKGPYENFYSNYFATQVMKNWGGAEWERWNGRLRDDLIAWQEKDGDARGSWAPRDRDDYSKSGGRLLTTCLATLTLEVYYRYQPLLPEQSTASP